MKIATWNCQGAFRNKAALITSFSPDIAIIQECECPERLTLPADLPQPTSINWFGDRPSKGIAILSFSGLQFTLDEAYDPTIRYCVPLRVTGAGVDLHLLAVWAMGHPDPKLSYVGQLALAIRRYTDFLRAKETLIVGDFNSNQVWDRKPRIGNHSWVVETLQQHGLVSVYHAWSGEAHGEETAKTWYMYRKQDTVYHIDYCFAPHSWLARLHSFAVGEAEPWLALSDHLPLFVEFTGRAPG